MPATSCLPHTRKIRLSTTATPHGETVSGDINSLIEKVNNTFDKFNRLKKTEKIKGGERVSVEFTYDGDGLRTQKLTKSSKDGYKGKVINYLYDRQHVILETNESDYILAAYVRGINYIGRYAGSSMSYYLYNGHGDVVQTVSESGEVQNQYDYDIFGNPTLTIESYSNPIRYSGEFYDEESGLYYLRARYYNPYTGRFISEDSYWGEDVNPMSLNLYTYCYNDPIQYIDPTGHWGGKAGEYDDSKLSREDQNKIKKLTDAYFETDDKDERARIHEEANEIRKNAGLKKDFDPDKKDSKAKRQKRTRNKNADSFANDANQHLNEKEYFTAEEWKDLSDEHSRKRYNRSGKDKTIDDVIKSINTEAELYSDYIIGSEDYFEDIDLIVKNKGDRFAIQQMDRDRNREGSSHFFSYSESSEYSNNFDAKYTKLVGQVKEKLGLHDGFTREFKAIMYDYYMETGKGAEDYFEEVVSPEEQDFEVLSEADLRAVLSLKATYAVYAQENRIDAMNAILRAIDTIRRLPRYKGKYDFSNRNGEYISMYGYHDKTINTDIHISQSNAARDKTIVNLSLTALGVASAPYSIIGLLISTGLTDEFDREAVANTVLNTELTAGSILAKGVESDFFTGLGVLKGIYDTGKDYVNLKDLTNTHVTISSGGVYETHVYQFNPSMIIEKAGKLEPVEYSVPAQFRHYEKRYPDPDLKLYYPGAGEKFWFD